MAGSNVSSATKYFPKVNEGFITTVAGAGVTSGGTIVPLSSVSGLTNGSVFVGIIEPGQTNEQTFTGDVDTANSQITNVVWTRGTNASHAAGKTVVDYITGTAINLISTGIQKTLKQDGTLKDGIVTATHLDSSAANLLNPVGAVLPYAGTSAPSGWLFCYGQAISRTTYATLFTAIGTTYGAGDGSSSFNLPDLRGRVIAGQDDMGGTSANRLTGATGGLDGDVLGGTGGAETHTLTASQMPSHNHTGTTSTNGNHSHTMGREYGSNTGLVAPGQFGQISTTGSHSFSTDATGDHNHTFTTSTSGSDAAHNNVQPTIILNYIIKT